MRLAVVFVATVTLVGSPAVVAACAALCGSGAGHKGHAASAAVLDSSPAFTDASEHHHHHEGMTTAVEVNEPVAMTPSAVLADGRCCAGGDLLLPALAAAVRFELDAAPALATGAVPASRSAGSPHVGGSPYRPPAPSPLPPGTPRVLRI